jgi:hypothetical protein
MTMDEPSGRMIGRQTMSARSMSEGDDVVVFADEPGTCGSPLSFPDGSAYSRLSH